VIPFHVAWTGDFLTEEGQPAYGDHGLSDLRRKPFIDFRYITELAPRPRDPDYWTRFYSLEVLPEHVEGLDGLVVLRPAMKRSTIEAAAERLVVIGRSGAGYEKVDVAACTACDVALFNAPWGLHHATASTALMFMLALAKRLAEQERACRAGRWELQPAIMGSEIEGRTLGIVGLGKSGKELARLAAPFSMRILACSRHCPPDEAARLGLTLVPLARLLAESDFVSLHARIDASNRRMIGEREFSLMKPTAFFINIARGALVDQAALVRALETRRIAGAGLDVFEVEPLPADDPLTRLDNVILTPHWSCSTTDVWSATGASMTAGILRAATGHVPDNVVNSEVLDRPAFQKKLAKFRRSGEC
jgi:phosphoglycerate dehydrogenase-like enzyme